MTIKKVTDLDMIKCSLEEELEYEKDYNNKSLKQFRKIVFNSNVKYVKMPSVIIYPENGYVSLTFKLKECRMSLCFIEDKEILFFINYFDLNNKPIATKIKHYKSTKKMFKYLVNIINNNIRTIKLNNITMIFGFLMNILAKTTKIKSVLEKELENLILGLKSAHIKIDETSFKNFKQHVKLEDFKKKPEIDLYYPNRTLRLSWKINKKCYIDLSFLSNGNISLLIDDLDDEKKLKDYSNISIDEYKDKVKEINSYM